MTSRSALFTVVVCCVIGLGFLGIQTYQDSKITTGAPPYGEAEEAIPPIDPMAWIYEFQRPDGPPRVGLQIGHYKNDELPEELAQLRGNTGTSGGGKWEWEVNKDIAERTAKLLEAEGIVIDILPTTVPPRYWADVFVAIHADGNANRNASGFKIASPWRDLSGKADDLVTLLQSTYKEQTNLLLDPNISRNMRGYYAFSWWRYEHAVHPLTTSVIVETGFLTSPNDRRILVADPQKAAQGIANGIIAYLQTEELLD